MNILACLNAYDASSIINVVTPLAKLHDRGAITLTSLLEREVHPWHVAQADVVVTCRNLERMYRPIYDLAAELHIPVVYDLDDDLFNVPPTDPNYGYYQHHARREQLRWMLSQARLVRVHSPVLQASIHPINPSTHLVRAGIDLSLLPDHLPEISPPPFEIVYATSRTRNDNLFPLIVKDIEALLRHYGELIRLNMLGYDSPDLRKYPNVRFVPFDSDYAGFFQKFTRYGYAIGLAPMLDDTFHMSKTNTKFRDYAAAGAAGVYTDCALYRGRDSVIQGETGYLAENCEGAWFNAIASLIEDPSRIEKIRANARQCLLTTYPMEQFTDEWLHDLQSVFIERERTTIPETSRWWFNGNVRTRNRWIEHGRLLYRRYVPAGWRVRLRDLRLGFLQRAMPHRHQH